MCCWPTNSLVNSLVFIGFVLLAQVLTLFIFGGACGLKYSKIDLLFFYASISRIHSFIPDPYKSLVQGSSILMKLIRSSKKKHKYK